jgi:hypothetical protein
MTAIDQTCPRCKKTLRGGGRPHMSQSPYSMPNHTCAQRRSSYSEGGLGRLLVCIGRLLKTNMADLGSHL